MIVGGHYYRNFDVLFHTRYHFKEADYSALIIEKSIINMALLIIIIYYGFPKSSYRKELTMDKNPKLSSYIGHHADLYDLFYADKPYSDEANFVHSCLVKHSSRPVENILELGCGTGTHSLFLEKLGYKIIATDYSNEMLLQAMHKAKEVNSNNIFRQQDMCSLDIPERPLDAIICLSYSICYATTNESFGRVINGAYSHLRPGGLFIFEFWNAAAMVSNYDPLRIKRCRIDDGEVIRISEAQIDYRSQLYKVDYSIYEHKKNGTFNYLSETQINRYFSLQEMSLFLTNAGFKPIKWFAGYKEDERITNETWNILCIAQS